MMAIHESRPAPFQPTYSHPIIPAATQHHQIHGHPHGHPTFPQTHSFHSHASSSSSAFSSSSSSTPIPSLTKPPISHSQSLFSSHLRPINGNCTNCNGHITGTSTPPSSSSSSCFAKRPKPNKKPTSSSSIKRATVQNSLEAKVEKAKGFHAFFVPLARSLPPAPPSSPILAAAGGTASMGMGMGTGSGSDGKSRDYFGQWDKERDRKGEEWVEDVRDIEAMDLDS